MNTNTKQQQKACLCLAKTLKAILRRFSKKYTISYKMILVILTIMNHIFMQSNCNSYIISNVIEISFYPLYLYHT